MCELTHLSLCSGIGGLDLAAEWAGFKTIAQSEIDKFASLVLAQRFGEGVHNFGDIRTITDASIRGRKIIRGKTTVLSAGIPCQPYSLAGKGLGDSDPRDLEQELMRVIGIVSPKWVIIENTPGLFSRSNQRYFHRILCHLSALGFSIAWGMWGACDVGLPHERLRIFIVGHKISDSIGKRCDTDAVLDREFEKSLHQEGERGIQARRGEFNRIHSRNIQQEIDAEYMCRADVVPEELDEIRCYGNAVAPQQAYPLFKAIADYEKGGENA